ncbi:MAG: hypothetical protein JWO86_8016, partial [Myxococcaceae bacterium]|nr:hypothetical protein [Myxococcaceae bacterium]
GNLLSGFLGRDLAFGLADPAGGGRRPRQGTTVREALRVREERGIENGATTHDGVSGKPVVDFVRRAHAKRAMTVLGVVPVKETSAVSARALNRSRSDQESPGGT